MQKLFGGAVAVLVALAVFLAFRAGWRDFESDVGRESPVFGGASTERDSGAGTDAAASQPPASKDLGDRRSTAIAGLEHVALAGMVIDELGNAVVDAYIGVGSPYRGGLSPELREYEDVSVRTDGSGRFALSLPKAAYPGLARIIVVDMGAERLMTSGIWPVRDDLSIRVERSVGPAFDPIVGRLSFGTTFMDDVNVRIIRGSDGRTMAEHADLSGFEFDVVLRPISAPLRSIEGAVYLEIIPGIGSVIFDSIAMLERSLVPRFDVPVVARSLVFAALGPDRCFHGGVRSCLDPGARSCSARRSGKMVSSRSRFWTASI